MNLVVHCPPELCNLRKLARPYFGTTLATLNCPKCSISFKYVWITSKYANFFIRIDPYFTKPNWNGYTASLQESNDFLFENIPDGMLPTNCFDQLFQATKQRLEEYIGLDPAGFKEVPHII